MAWHLHAIELSAGLWECRWGRHTYGTAPSLEHALCRLREVAAEAGIDGEFAFLVHRLDDTVCRD